MNRREVLTYLERKQNEWARVEVKNDYQKRYSTGYANGLYKALTLVKNMVLPLAIRDYLKKSGYPIVDMDRAVASVEHVMLARLDDVMEIIWDDVEDDPETLLDFGSMFCASCYSNSASCRSCRMQVMIGGRDGRTMAGTTVPKKNTKYAS